MWCSATLMITARNIRTFGLDSRTKFMSKFSFISTSRFENLHPLSIHIRNWSEFYLDLYSKGFTSRLIRTQWWFNLACLAMGLWLKNYSLITIILGFHLEQKIIKHGDYKLWIFIMNLWFEETSLSIYRTSLTFKLPHQNNVWSPGAFGPNDFLLDSRFI